VEVKLRLALERLLLEVVVLHLTVDQLLLVFRALHPGLVQLLWVNQVVQADKAHLPPELALQPLQMEHLQADGF
jgi:hypothetical protein